MKTRQQFFVTAVLFVLAFLAGCSSGPQVVTNSDPGADFSSLRTFDFMQPLSTDQGNVRTIMSNQLISATTLELDKLGMSRDTSSPDVVINFVFETQQQIRTRNTGASVSATHRTGRYGTWGGTISTPQVETTTQGVLSIDMVDPARNQLIWEGSATSRITSNTQQNQQGAIDTAVEAIFAQFP